MRYRWEMKGVRSDASVDLALFFRTDCHYPKAVVVRGWTEMHLQGRTDYATH